MYGHFDLYAGRIALRLGAVWHWATLPPGVLAIGPSVWPNTFDVIGPADCILDRELHNVFRDQMQPIPENPWLTVGSPLDDADLKRAAITRFGRVAVYRGGWLLSDGRMDFGDKDDLHPDGYDWIDITFAQALEIPPLP